MNRIALWLGVMALLGGVSLGSYIIRSSALKARSASSHESLHQALESKRSEIHAAPEADGEMPVPPPPFTEDIFPCSECHEPDDYDPERREMSIEHEDIVLHHDEANRWCLDCHDAEDRDQLHLADGTLVPFTESYRLCGQCHGPTFRDWKRGIHGKRTGNWNGTKRYLLCVHCHDPHAPRFKPIHPFPAPVPPQAID